MNYTRESWRMNRPLTPPIAQPCGYVSTSGEVCQKPRVIGLSNKESKACVDHGEAVKEILRRKYAAKRREKKARGR